ncbi:MAG: hypothetical protein AAGA92_14810 [Planctomycetota bacterium]
MSNRKPKKAEDFLRELESDPEWVAQRDARERELAERAAVYAADEADLVAEIRAAGFGIGSVWDLVNNAPHSVLERRFTAGYSAVYPILIRHLTLSHHERVREGIIRALTVKDGGEELEQALLAQFKKETDDGLKWVLANALQTAVPYHRRRKWPEIAKVLSGRS